MLECFKTKNIDPQCRKEESAEKETTEQQTEEEAKKAAEKAERKRKKREEKERRKKEKELASACGSCYGAEDNSPNRNGCCNTCDDVRRAYEVFGTSTTEHQLSVRPYATQPRVVPPMRLLP